MMRSTAGPALVLDNEAVQLLLLTRRHDRRRRALFAAIEGAEVVRTPTAVRVEAGAARSAVNALLGRLTRDADLDTAAANRAVALGEAVRGSGSVPSVIDLCVAVEAERLAVSRQFTKVEVLTSDRADLMRLAGVSDEGFGVVQL